jgi:HlyD family secretion protein
LESSELIANLKQATLTISLAKAKLRQLRELQKPQAEQAFKQAQINFETAQRATLRSQKLLSQGFLNQAAVDESQRAEQVAQAQMYSVEQQVSSLRTGGSDEVLAKENLAQAQAAREAALARLNYSHIRAPVAGTLIARNVEAGDIVQPGKILMVLSPDANAGETQLVIQIDERNLRLLSLGQKAFASADAFPQQRFVAELVYINPGIDLQRGSVEAKLKVSDPPDYLKQDMTVSFDIQVAQRKSAVLLAATAIHDIDSSAPWVLLVTKGKVQRVSVRLGLRSNGMIEIVEGLQNQDQVLPLSAVNIGEGKRIRPIAQRTGGG